MPDKLEPTIDETGSLCVFDPAEGDIIAEIVSAIRYIYHRACSVDYNHHERKCWPGSYNPADQFLFSEGSACFLLK